MKGVLTLEKKDNVSIRKEFEVIKIHYNDPTERNSHATTTTNIRIPAIACVTIENDYKDLTIELINGKVIRIKEGREFYGILTNIIYKYERARIPRPVEFECRASSLRCNY